MSANDDRDREKNQRHVDVCGKQVQQGGVTGMHAVIILSEELQLRVVDGCYRDACSNNLIRGVAA